MPRAEHKPLALRAALCALVLLLAGCSAAKVVDQSLGDLTKNMLEASGLKKPEPPPLPQADLLKLPRKVSLRVHASKDLNHDNARRPLSLVLRVYKLKSTSAFLQAPYEAFGVMAREKELLGEDVLEVREVVLVPGQRYEVEEKVPRDAAAVGVVALFHSPLQQRWRFAFDAAAAERSGLLLGAHGCALSVAQGQAVDAKVDLLQLGGTVCPR